jgi:RimJ/RimL family protein N-acetyltransferase
MRGIVHADRVPERIALHGRVVRLDPLDVSHVDGLLRAAGEDRSSYGYTLVPATAAEMHDYVLSALEDERTGWALPFAVRLGESERIVGSTRFLDLAYWTDPMSWPPGRPSPGGQGIPSVAEIGSSWLARSVQRTSVNTESKQLMLSHAFETWGVERVTFKTDARNERSRRAIERIGATFEGIRRAHVPATDGSIRDTAYYSILRVEWPAIQDGLVARPRGSAG